MSNETKRYWSENGRWASKTVIISCPEHYTSFAGVSLLSKKPITGPYVMIDNSSDEYGSVLLSVEDVRLLLRILEDDERAMSQKAAGLPSGDAIRGVVKNTVPHPPEKVFDTLLDPCSNNTANNDVLFGTKR